MWVVGADQKGAVLTDLGELTTPTFLLSTGGGGHITVFYAALLLPFFAGRKLYLGFRDRDRTRAERAAAAEAIRAAEEWRSARRW
ncbi:hypothetical protein ACIBCL_15425 [Micromonospora zamorensis]|uniref:hypothetical protein n=1 Tax=Micromonospora zamorensis TaxID=709883 RepID=UPI00378A3CEE